MVLGIKYGSLLLASVISMVTVLVPVCCGRPRSRAKTFKINNHRINHLKITSFVLGDLSHRVGKVNYFC